MESFVDFKTELMFLLHLTISALLGGFIGYDRERDGNRAGIRTYAAVCMGSTIFTLIATHLVHDPGSESRIIANIVTGIGFLGAGIIYRSNNKPGVQGLTTAATIWAAAGVGVAVALNMFVVAICSSVFLYFLLSLHHRKWYVRWKNKIRSEKSEYEDD